MAEKQTAIRTEDNSETQAVVENFIGEISRETMWNVADNFIMRAKMCPRQDGGHFKHLK